MRVAREASRVPRFETYGRYVLLDGLAMGGMAEVFLAKPLDGLATPLVALKRLRPELATDPHFIGMFLDEARISGQLRHPHIAALHELGRVGKSHYLAMDFVWGKDLLHIVRRCRALGAMLPPALVAYLGQQLAAALHHAHQLHDDAGEPMHIVHRDVSPQNVLVGFDGQVRVIDFGIAKASARVTRTQEGVLKGKVGYMSPEQARGREVDHRSDIFAAATCLYELLTLRSLFARADTMMALDQVRNARVPPLAERREDVPASMRDALHRALALDPADRFETAAELGEALAVEPAMSTDEARQWMEQLFLRERRQEGTKIEALSRIGHAQAWRLDAPDPLSTAPTRSPRRLREGFEILWAREEAGPEPEDPPTEVSPMPEAGSGARPVPEAPPSGPTGSGSVGSASVGSAPVDSGPVATAPPAAAPTPAAPPPSAPTLAAPTDSLPPARARRPRVHGAPARDAVSESSAPGSLSSAPKPAVFTRPAQTGGPAPSQAPASPPPAATSRLGVVAVALTVLVIGSLAAFVWWWLATGHTL